ncbi:hypothetical protein AACH06_09220 [Ideonella sp. DXS29W]|uniref:Crp/Fnr family transcriptional regulator n=1 Tax=Ideonella lacteola TaxID=2984193 RepID=A0ABU9BNG2_9BURK
MSGQFRHEPPIVITNCTARKRSREQVISSAEIKHAASVRDLAGQWVRLTRGRPTVAAAGELYGGRSFRDAAVAAESCQGDLYVISAGFGLVSNTALLPNYALTIADGEGSIAAMLAHFDASAADWWAALCAELGSPGAVARLLRRRQDALVLLALPSTYLQMVGPELGDLTAQELRRLRVFTSLAGARQLELRIADCVLPYDDRLNDVEGHAGTRTDFAQRALRHFVEVLHGQELSLAEGRSAVLHALSRHQPPATKARVRATDDEICSAIRSFGESGSHGVSRLLRRLRDERNIACEQGRFRDLWRQVQQECGPEEVP